MKHNNNNSNNHDDNDDNDNDTARGVPDVQLDRLRVQVDDLGRLGSALRVWLHGY